MRLAARCVRGDVHLGVRAVATESLKQAGLAHVLEVDQRVVGRPRAKGAQDSVHHLATVGVRVGLELGF